MRLEADSQVRRSRRLGRPKREAQAIAMDAALMEWGRWVRSHHPDRHLDAKVVWPGVRYSHAPVPHEATALIIEEAMLAARSRWPLLYRAGFARYVRNYSDSGARDYCRCSERQYRDRMQRLYGYLAGFLEARRPEVMDAWLR